MISKTGSNRIETLVALTLVLHSQETLRELDSWEDTRPPASIDGTGISSALTERDQEAFGGCCEQYKKLSDSQQIDWLRSMLAPIVKDSAVAPPFVDELMHPSHLVALLRNEPRAIQSLVLTSLPGKLGRQVAGSIELISESSLDETDRKLTKLLRSFLLSRFIAKTDLGKLNQFDLLSADQLGRFIQLLGFKELVITYGNLRIDSNPALKPELHTLERITLSQKLVSDALAENSNPNTLVDHIGLSVLARAISRLEPMYAAYTGQRLPIETTGEFLDLVTKAIDESDSELYDQLLAEVEDVAEHLLSSPAFEATEREARHDYDKT